MSTLPIPDLKLPAMKDVEDHLDQMNRAYAMMMPKEIAGTFNLMAHPMAGAAAMSALGLGVASQAFGMWMGAMAGAAETSMRIWEDAGVPEPAPKTTAKSKPAATVTPISAGRKARAGARTIAADSEIVARQVVEVATETAGKMAGDATRTMATVVEATAATTDIMPEDFHRPPLVEKPATPDDLKRISGVGPKLESVLNGLGVWTFAQIAAWKPEEVAWVDDYLSFKGRIARDGWIEQAGKLTSGS